MNHRRVEFGSMNALDPAPIFEITLRTLAVCAPALLIALVIGLPIGIELAGGSLGEASR